MVRAINRACKASPGKSKNIARVAYIVADANNLSIIAGISAISGPEWKRSNDRSGTFKGGIRNNLRSLRPQVSINTPQKARGLRSGDPPASCPPFVLQRGYPRERISYGSGVRLSSGRCRALAPLWQRPADDHPDDVVAVVRDVGVAAGVDRDRPRVVQPGGGRKAAVAGEFHRPCAAEQTHLPRCVDM